MIINPKKDCPHVENAKLIDKEEFRKILYEKLKCQNCDESQDLWICFICGERYCSKYIKGHFADHHKQKHEHCIGLSIVDLSAWCYECINDNQKDSNSEQNSKEAEKGCYIESKKVNEYIKAIINDFNNAQNEKQKKSRDEFEKKINENIKEDKFSKKKEICSHIKDENIINYYKNIFGSGFQNTIKMIEKFRDKMAFVGLCLICGEIIYNEDNLDEHYNENKDKLYINMLDLTIICMDCKSRYNIELMNDLQKYRILYQYLEEKGLELPKEVKTLTKEEIYKLKYDALIQDFKDKKFSKILFMVGAGISTSAGIPDFRSNTGLFKQLQDKYNLSSPEEFFLKTTFLKNPIYFYEFTKLFDLSQIDSTISHKFMNFFVSKNIVKYIFTQNIDGLEKKAKIPEEKLIYAHGNFYKGHCAKCDRPIDIEKINEGVDKGEIYYCPDCKGPCKPNVVFYGEGLPHRFFEKLEESRDIDLIIIMGTSLKVQPFASIPYLTNREACVVVFNMEEVGEFKYDYLSDDSIFIEGKTDEGVIQFLKDIGLYEEFDAFIMKEYNEQLEKLINKKNEMIDVNKKEEEEKNAEKLADDIQKLNLDKKE